MSEDPVVDAWVSACEARPGQLPQDFEPVQTRLIRAVGRAEHPTLGTVYLKVMGFPRFRDRLRYAFRRLPAVHEAAMLERVVRSGVAAPRVVRAHGARRLGLPRVSVLITAGLERAADDVEFGRALGVAAELARAGIFHPDLNRGNFVALVDGRVAVLDLQSARAVRGPIGPQARLRMAAKLVMDFDAVDRVAEVASSGLVDPRDAADLGGIVETMRVAAVRHRVARCLKTTTEFIVERRMTGKLHRRRTADVGQADCREHPRARELWIGDRYAELVDRSPPVLAAMFQKAWWLPGRNSAKIATSGGRNLSAVEERRLHEAYSRARDAGAA
ncbi:MAG: hypothetical protein KDB80_12035 [Planctomycetes bacterium]|nr:hypothetical protein [Planctomycetota bacterium]